ncbi:rodlin [Streptomyces sp. NPDC053427]|uniref:rodlin n=1 Tax=Streptomyces sp. NPDC053427 TaxID=3365701 RepID=UPI0037CF607C
MIKKVLAATAVAASVVGISATVVTQAMAIGDRNSTSTGNGNGVRSALGNSLTHGKLSPRMELIQGSLNKSCVAVPLKANVARAFGFLSGAARGVNALSSPRKQQCAENSTRAKGDEALSHIVDDIPVPAGNGVHKR